LEAACAKALPQLQGITWGGFDRGLVCSVYPATPAEFRHHAGSIAGVGSVHRVSFDKLDGFAALAEVPILARFTELSVRIDDDGYRNGDPEHRFNDDLQAVLASPHCPRLRRLDLNTCQLGPRGAKALADCPRMESLVHLCLLDNYIGDEGMAALAASPYLSALRILRIDQNNLGPAGVEALAASVSLGGLEDLCIGELVSNDRIGPAVGLALGQSPYLIHLRELNIDDEIGALGAAALAQAPHLAGLRHLNLRVARGPEAARALAASPYLCQLRSLELHACEIGDEGAKALACSPILANLEYLDLSRNDLTDEGALALAASPYLECLKHGRLQMQQNHLTADGMQALRARLGDAVRFFFAEEAICPELLPHQTGQATDS
jgi:Ran GTPase-activating protein (RanGAP) involved in mRNA processing and transport